MTLEEAKALAAAELRQEEFPSQRAFAAAMEARARLCGALGEALQGDPAMKVVEEVLRLAEEYRAAIGTNSRNAGSPEKFAEPSGTVEMTRAEAAAMMERERPARPSPSEGISPADTPPATTPQPTAPPSPPASISGEWRSPPCADPMEELAGDLGDSAERGVRWLWRKLFGRRP